ncbi:hypothetical protein [Streptosporangium carneum]|uniref:Uncharacterized protein n=1 Tax=Streptosporangium carneum TaxID=47481 RepID=A0A9W6MCN8_9ACTN|nr:hypothetical protein [Streptosporangium carneum]GLK09222.1 hypothetical protein GCM10017600_26280 [Streptosporangium carneum]
MSYVITVYGPDDGSGECAELYEAAMGGHGIVIEHWAKPAQRLGLAFLSQLPGEDLTVRHEQLTAFSEELDALARHWTSTPPNERTISTSAGGHLYETPLLVHLLHRLSLVRAAVRIAELSGGHLYI